MWFVHAEGDDISDNEAGAKLGTAGEYPDALRTFCKATNGDQYLEPNQFLVVGPDEKRCIGSLVLNSSGKFATAPQQSAAPKNYIDGTNLGSTVTDGVFSGNYTFMVAKANIGGRGLNISEPLWTGSNISKDPYIQLLSHGAPEGDGTPSQIDPTLPFDEPQESGTLNRYAVMDIPFELPKDWSDAERGEITDKFYKNTVANYPIVKDGLFGTGTVPAYKSAFVQRVADPNRPYHPLLNPYITVDWNMMDLTVYTGECVEIGGLETENAHVFSNTDAYRDAHEANNNIKLAENKALDVDEDKDLGYADAFSSRQWGNAKQETFAPVEGQRPNPWARAFKDHGDKAGLQRADEAYESGSATNASSAMRFVPKHTLGFFNDIGERGTWQTVTNSDGVETEEFVPSSAATTFQGLNNNYLGSASGVYSGAPRRPYEHLVWNDAPFSNPMELLLVPASSSGRFGLEFVRNKDYANMGGLYRSDKQKSLGSRGFFGYEDWKDSVPGAYLNFFTSSRKPGETLNLCKVLEFTYVPSLYLGSKRLIAAPDGQPVTDESGNPLFFSKRREPGKININTTTKPAWQAVSPSSERVSSDARLPGLPWAELWGDKSSRRPTNSDPDAYAAPDYFSYFQPSHTANLSVQMDGTKAPVPTFASLLTQGEGDVDSDSSDGTEPLFDNISPLEDENGQTLYGYRYKVDPDDEESEVVEGVTSDLDSLPSYAEHWEVKQRRNNLYEMTAEMQRLSGLTTTRSNAFAVWTTVGYFEVERCNPGVNMPARDPDGNALTFADLINPNYKWYHYYQAIYPDGYTYGKELGSEYGESKRHRGFSIIDRSIPVDFRRGNSGNYEKAILLKHAID